MKKPKLTPEELSRIRSLAGKKGAKNRIALGHNRGGRPRGSANKNPSGIEETRTLTVRASAHRVFAKCASFVNKPLVDFMSIVSDGLKKKNPALFGISDELKV